MADDLGYGSLGCYNSKEVSTPNIDRLAASGMLFTDFHSNGAMCTPTRAALMTGRYPQRCTWVDDEELSPVFREQRRKNLPQRWAWGIARDELTIARVLQESGYRTGLIGKWHLGYDFRFHPMNYGFDEFRGFVGGSVDYHTHVAQHGLRTLDWWHDMEIRNEDGYATDLLTKYAINFIERNRDRPFFLYLAHAAPHAPWQGREPKEKKPPVATYKEMIEILDESVGLVVEALRHLDLIESTLVVFCSDNGADAPPGISANAPLQGKKGSMQEGGHRVPFIASWPGRIRPGSKSNATVMTMDFLPTFAELAGSKLPPDRQIDGANIMPILSNEVSGSERVLHWLFADSWCVRRGPWKLSGKGKTPLALVNVERDLEERTNLLKDHPELAGGLRELHRNWINTVGNR